MEGRHGALGGSARKDDAIDEGILKAKATVTNPVMMALIMNMDCMGTVLSC